MSDDGLLELFRTSPKRAWDLFLERYSDYILSVLRHMGFDHDQAMDRFVYICEKLAEQDFRRLKGVQFTGREGELKPWLRTVTRNFAVSWAWSTEGRRRLFKSVSELSVLHQRVFELYFWQGRRPSEICEMLRMEGRDGVDLIAVLDALEEVFAHLDAGQRWRLMSRLARDRRAVAIAVEDPESGLVFEPRSAEPGAEEKLLEGERRQMAERAIADLDPKSKLIFQLRYEQSLSLAEVAKITQLSVSAVKRNLKASFERLRGQVSSSDNRGTSQGARP